MDYLAKKHEHPRDRNITFDEGPHIYTIDGESDFMSVTTWNHSHFGHFDADKIIDKMMKSRNWSNSKYYGKTADEIKNQWETNRDEAANAGTAMHYNIECFYNGVAVDEKCKDCDEWRYFEQFHNDYKDLKPYRTEWMIYDKELKFAGSVDMLFENEDGTLEIYDWKRSKEIKYDNQWQSAKTPCISHLDDCNYYHYCLQLNTYKAILEKNYGKTITGMYLVCLHPNNENKSYQRIKVKDLSQEIEDLFEVRRKMLELGLDDPSKVHLHVSPQTSSSHDSILFGKKRKTEEVVDDLGSEWAGADSSDE